MRAILSAVFCLFLTMPPLLGQANYEYGEVDHYAMAAPESVSYSVTALGQYLGRYTGSERHKARAIYTWITHNISYDWQAYQSRQIPDQSADMMISSRKGICAGYAKLFKALCDAAEVKCEVVSGFVKATDYRLGEPLDEPNHAWNAIWVDNRWQLVDVTWGAGGRNRQSSDYYFLAPPQQMIYSHLPEDPRWQLLPRKVSIYEFERIFMVYPPFFDFQVEGFNHKEALINVQQEALTINFSAPTNYVFSPTLEYKGGATDLFYAVSRQGTQVSICVDELRRGQLYQLHIFGAKSDTCRVLELLMTYFINVRGEGYRYYADKNTDFKLDEQSLMPYWFMVQYQELLVKKDYRGIASLLSDNIVRYPNNKWLYLKLGYMYEKLQKAPEAAEMYKKALQLDANYFEAHYSLGVLFYNEAVNLYEALRQMSPQEYQLKSREYVSRIVGYFTKAKPYFEQALELNAGDEQIKSALVNIDKFVKKGD